jgi:hypothetical protein
MVFSVSDAVRIATDAHDGQLDKSGKPYIGHPVRVMNRVSGERERMAAVLHDVIEDTPVTADDLRAAGCPERIVTAVVALSHLPGEPQAGYLARVAADPIASSSSTPTSPTTCRPLGSRHSTRPPKPGFGSSTTRRCDCSPRT